ncbi:MAG TPA: glycosyltransferase family 4 protein, partial [Burkholderiaceae bacterium]|nr:glycosyltransferase family 4 protein [Burkholderiaceae bacterium]
NPTRALLLESQPILDQKVVTIWNGMDRQHPMLKSEIADFRHSMGLHAECVLVVLMGRINRLKGQKLLVEAAMHAQRQGLTQVHYLIVGSAPAGQEHFLHDLQQTLATSGIENLFTMMEFQADIWRIWDASDIAVLPSTEPESFGMVALEAMAAGKPVVAAAHGGPLDIVIDGKTGTLVAPNDAVALADAIATLAQDKTARERMGRAGLQRLDEQFSLRNYVRGFEQLYESIGESRI